MKFSEGARTYFDFSVDLYIQHATVCSFTLYGNMQSKCWVSHATRLGKAVYALIFISQFV